MEQRIEIERLEQAVNIFGSFDENIRLMEAEFRVTVANRDGELRITGEPEDAMLAAAFLRGRAAPVDSRAMKALCRMSGRLEGESIPIPDQL